MIDPKTMTTVTHILLTIPVIMGGATIVGLLTNNATKLLIPNERDRTKLQMLVAVLSPTIVFVLMLTAHPK